MTKAYTCAVVIFLVTAFFACGNVFAQETTDAGGGQEVSEVVVEQSSAGPVDTSEMHSKDKKIEDVLTRNALASDITGERPNPEGTPTKVKIGLYVFDIAQLEDARQVFTADFRLVLRWYDPRLADKAKEMREYPIEDVWNPLISIMNRRDLRSIYPDEVHVDSDGHVIYSQRFIGELTVPLNLRNFPLDKHKMYIQVRSFYGPDEIQLIIDEDMTGWANVLSIPDWDVSQGEARINKDYSTLQKRDLAQMEFSFNIKRFLGFYMWKIIIPLALIVFMSWGVFWVDPARLEAQLGLSATAVLTLFAFQFAITNLIPRVSYLTRIDRFTMSCSLLIFFALIIALTTSYCVKKHWVPRAILIDRIARIVFPITFAGVVYFSFFA